MCLYAFLQRNSIGTRGQRRLDNRILARALNFSLFLLSFGVAPDCKAYPHGYPQDGNARQVSSRFSPHEIKSLFRLLRCETAELREKSAPRNSTYSSLSLKDFF